MPVIGATDYKRQHTQQNKGGVIVPTVATGHWYSELRNIERDIAASFASTPMIKPLKYMAISADTDNTGGDSLARMTDLPLSGLRHEKTR
jgi:hypothetical protein